MFKPGSRKMQAMLGVLLPVFGCLLAGPALAAEIRLGGILPGGGVIHKNILSMRELRYADIVKQKTDYSCGAAAIATILKYAYGQDVGEEEVMRDMLKVSDPEIVRTQGFSLLNMKHYIDSLGMSGRGYQVSAQVLENVKLPVVVLLDIKGYKHFVVLKKTVNGKAYIADPALGNKVLDIETFAAGWNGVIFAAVGEGLDQQSPLLHPSEPLSARKLLAIHSLTSKVPGVDFGFLYSDLL